MTWTASWQAAGVRAAPLHRALPRGRLRGGVPRGGAEELRLRPHAARGALQRAAEVRGCGCCCVLPKTLSRLLTGIDKVCTSPSVQEPCKPPSCVGFGLHSDLLRLSLRLWRHQKAVATPGVHLPERLFRLWHCNRTQKQHTARTCRSSVLAVCIQLRSLLHHPLFHAWLSASSLRQLKLLYYPLSIHLLPAGASGGARRCGHAGGTSASGAAATAARAGRATSPVRAGCAAATTSAPRRATRVPASRAR